jgi:hypothetical protein
MQVTLHGILRKDHAGTYGHYLLTDSLTKIVYELQGPGLDDLVGASVEATGSIFDTTPAEGASRVISVSDIHQMPVNELPGMRTTPPATGGAPTPSGDTAPPSGGGPDLTPGETPAPAGGATPEAGAASTGPTPVTVHSDTAKILVIVGIAAGAVVGVALGLGGGKSSTVSPE